MLIILFPSQIGNQASHYPLFLSMTRIKVDKIIVLIVMFCLEKLHQRWVSSLISRSSTR